MMTGADIESRSCDPKAAAELLRALAHPMRLAILCRLLEGELAVAGFESELGLRQPSLSQQLGLLREAGLVTTRREAKSVVYGLVDPRLRILLDALRIVVSDGSQAMVGPESARLAESGHGAAPAPRQTARPSVAGTHECGMFAVAGWPAGRGPRRDDRRA